MTVVGKGICRELAEDGLQPISYTGEGPGGSLYCVNMQTIIRRKRLLVSARPVAASRLYILCHVTPATMSPTPSPPVEHACDEPVVSCRNPCS